MITRNVTGQASGSSSGTSGLHQKSSMPANGRMPPALVVGVFRYAGDHDR
ncbi:MAG: hypothetical protein AAGC80_32310 [Rhodococcus sp. (in: high G+C Gram-positive bacteria)]